MLRLRSRFEVNRRPRDHAELTQTLDRCRAAGESSLADVATYILAHPYEVAFGKVREIAAAIPVSAASVIRCAMAVGFSGFQDMRDFYRDPLLASPRRSPSDAELK